MWPKSVAVSLQDEECALMMAAKHKDILLKQTMRRNLTYQQLISNCNDSFLRRNWNFWQTPQSMRNRKTFVEHPGILLAARPVYFKCERAK